MKEKFGSITIWAVLLWCLVCGSLFSRDYLYKLEQAARLRETELLVELASVRSSVNLLMNRYIPEKQLAFSSPIHLDDFLRYTSPFGPRNNPLKENIGGRAVTEHEGVDMAGIPEARATAVARGIVRDKYYSKGWHKGRYWKGHKVFDGYVVLIHLDERGVPTGYISHYGHLGEIYVTEGEIIEQGETIGRINEEVNGLSTGPHLHFAIEKNGEFLPPFKHVDMPEWM